MFVVQYRIGAESTWHAAAGPTSYAAATGVARAKGQSREGVQVRMVPVQTPKSLYDLKV